MTPAPREILRLFTEAAHHEQTAAEAESELLADGVDVERFIERVHRDIRKATRKS